MNSKYSFDPLCLELAIHFLPDGVSEEAKNAMAQAIQDAVDAHLLREDVDSILSGVSRVSRRQMS